MVWFPLLLLGYHAFLITKNFTTYERYRLSRLPPEERRRFDKSNPFNEGPLINWLTVLFPETYVSVEEAALLDYEARTGVRLEAVNLRTQRLPRLESEGAGAIGAGEPAGPEPEPLGEGPRLRSMTAAAAAVPLEQRRRAARTARQGTEALPSSSTDSDLNVGVCDTGGDICIEIGPRTPSARPSPTAASSEPSHGRRQTPEPALEPKISFTFKTGEPPPPPPPAPAPEPAALTSTSVFFSAASPFSSNDDDDASGEAGAVLGGGGGAARRRLPRHSVPIDLAAMTPAPQRPARGLPRPRAPQSSQSLPPSPRRSLTVRVRPPSPDPRESGVYYSSSSYSNAAHTRSSTRTSLPSFGLAMEDSVHDRLDPSPAGNPALAPRESGGTASGSPATQSPSRRNSSGYYSAESSSGSDPGPASSLFELSESSSRAAAGWGEAQGGAGLAQGPRSLPRVVCYTHPDPSLGPDPLESSAPGRLPSARVVTFLPLPFPSRVSIEPRAPAGP